MGEDRLLLLDHFRRFYAAQAHRPAFDLSADARQSWIDYAFPGNVRELRNIVIRLTAKYPGKIVDQAALEAELDVLEETDTPPVTIAPLEPTPVDASDPLAAAMARLQSTPFSLDQLLAETEQSYIEAALRLSNGNVSRAARLLGINRTTLYNRMESAARET